MRFWINNRILMTGPVTSFLPASARQLNSKHNQSSNLRLRAVGALPLVPPVIECKY